MSRAKTVEIEAIGGGWQAQRDEGGVVRIYRDNGGRWEYAGQGRWGGDGITDCSAELVPGNASQTEDVYEALDEALADDETPSESTLFD